MTTNNVEILTDNAVTDEFLRSVIEAVLYTATEPLTVARLTKKIKSAISKRRLALNSDSLGESVSEESSSRESSNEVTTVLQGVSSPFFSEALQNSNSTESSLSTSESQDDQTMNENFQWVDNSHLNTENADNADFNSEGNIQAEQKNENEELTNQVKAILEDLQNEYAQSYHGMELVQVAKGYQLRTKYEIAEYLRDEKIKAPARLSPSSLETLAIIAYQQPVSKIQIEQIRGVDCSGVLKSLLDKELIRIVGRSDEAGKPTVYGTATRFLEVFGFNGLNDLPDPRDFEPMFADLKHNPYAEIKVDDLVESETWDAVSEEDSELLGELDEKIKNLKKAEEAVVATQNPKVPEVQAQPASPELESAMGVLVQTPLTPANENDAVITVQENVS